MSWTFGVRRSAFGVALAILAGCAPRVAVVDAVSGLPIDARVSEIADGRLLVEASGYDMWSGPPQAQVALHPLWIRRFADEQVAPRRTPAPPCAGCPGERNR